MIPADVFKRPDKPNRVIVTKREDFELLTSNNAQRAIYVDKETECHVTPPEVAERMVDYVGPLGNVLEPSAGTGNLIQALLNYGISENQITSVEKHISLASSLRERFNNKVKVYNQCFLQFAEETEMRFDTIIMNPPFRPIQEHTAAAQGLLNSGGKIIILSPVSFEKDGFELCEKLSEQTFATTKVKTHILEYQLD